MYLNFVVNKIEFVGHRQVDEDSCGLFYLVEYKSGTRSEKDRSSSAFSSRVSHIIMVECDLTAIQWHRNTVVVIHGTSFSCFGDQGTCFHVDGQWFIENGPHDGFVTGWSSQTTFVSEFEIDYFRPSKFKWEPFPE